MVPMGVAMGASVLAGNAVGRGDHAGLRAAARAAFLVGGGFMVMTAFALIAMPITLAGIYTRDAAVLAFAATLLPIAGVFQVFDGIQVVGAGILRGLGRYSLADVINRAVSGAWLTAACPLLNTPLGPLASGGASYGSHRGASILVLRVRHAVEGTSRETGDRREGRETETRDER